MKSVTIRVEDAAGKIHEWGVTSRPDGGIEVDRLDAAPFTVFANADHPDSGVITVRMYPKIREETNR